MEKHGQSVDMLRLHREAIVESERNEIKYISWLKSKQLFFNEHYYYCECGNSIKDQIKIFERSDLNDDLAELEEILSNIISEFSIARRNLFLGQNVDLIEDESLDSQISSIKEKYNSSLIVNAFKSAYSILDRIGLSIIEIFEINPVEKGMDPSQLYFLNMWDPSLIDPLLFDRNIYLQSLYSIAKDLDRTDFSALRKFKKFRNAFEHKNFHIVKKRIPTYVSIQIAEYELVNNTEQLLILTKSAIMSFIFLVRLEYHIFNRWGN